MCIRDSYWFVLQNSSNTTVAGPGVVNDSSPSATPSFSFDTTTVSDGTYTIKLEARDAAGNKDSNSVEWVTVTVDKTAPTVNAGADRGSQTAAFVQTGTASDATSAIVTTWSTVSGPGTVTYGSPNALMTNVSASTAGNYVVKLKAVDSAGNPAEDTFTFTWV